VLALVLVLVLALEEDASLSETSKPPSLYVPKRPTITRYKTKPTNRFDTKSASTGCDNQDRASWHPETEIPIENYAWAGGVAGIIADTCMHPFDTISTRLKVQGMDPTQPAKYHGLFRTARTMVAEEGVRSLFNGVSATILCAIPSSAIYFGMYEFVKGTGKQHGQVTNEYHMDAVHLAAGVSAELAASVVVVPFEVVKSRMQASSTRVYQGAMNGIVTIARNEGFIGLFAGYRACLMLDCSFSGLQFVFYERLRKVLKAARVQAPPDVDSDMDYVLASMEDSMEDFVAGAVSGGIAAWLSNPLDVVAARLMTQDPKRRGTRLYAGTLDCLLSVAKHEGINGLWSGSLARVLSIVPLSALTFTLYEKLKCFFNQKSVP